MIEAIAKRKSIRSFADKKVEAEKVESLLRAAMRAPSGINGQPWEFIVIDDRAVMDEIRAMNPAARALQSAAVAIVVVEKEIPFRIEKGLPENVKPYSIVGVGCPAEDVDLEAVDRFDASRIHYNKY